MHWLTLWSALGGLLVGVWGRLAVPGSRRARPWSRTPLLGLAGGLAGGVLATTVLGRSHETIDLLVAIAIAALLVFGFAAYERSGESPPD